MSLIWNLNRECVNNIESNFDSNEESYSLTRNLIVSTVDLEEDYVTRLQIFVDNVITPIQLQDTVEKRELLLNKSVCSCFSAWQDFLVASTTFIQDMNQFYSTLEYNIFYHAFVKFKPSFHNLSTYFKEICNVLYALNSLSNPITSVLNLSNIFFELSMEDYLVLPIQHYENYVNYFKNILDLFSSHLDHATYPIFEELYQDFQTSTQALQDVLLEEGSRFQLLALQQQFKGRPLIYSPTRILLLEGQLSLILPTAGSNGYITKIIYGHLFNDCMTYSEVLQNNDNNNKYEFLSILDFSFVKISVKAAKEFDFIITRGTAKDTFHCRSTEERDIWVSTITQTLQDCTSSTTSSTKMIQGIVNNLADKNMSAVLNQLQNFMGIQKSPVTTTVVESALSTPVANPSPASLPLQPQQPIQQIRVSQSSLVNGNNNTPGSNTIPVSSLTSDNQHHQLLSTPSATSKSNSNSYKLGQSTVFSPPILALQALQSTLKQNMFVLDILNQVIVQPILIASKGASLRVGSINIPSDNNNNIKSTSFSSSSSHYTNPIADIGSWVSRSSHKVTTNNKYSRTSANYCVIVDQLRNYDIQIFMTSIVEILNSYRTICQELDLLLIVDPYEQIEVDDTCIINAVISLFQSTVMDSFYSHYISYANTLQALIRLLNTTLLEFIKEADTIIAPKDIMNLLHSGIGGLKRILFQVETFKTKLDCNQDDLNSIIKSMETSVLAVEQAIYKSRNEEKMEEIRASFASMDPQLELILYSDRVFLREGNLIKVCRKKQKQFHFWLFHDYIIYGSTVNSLVGGTYKFNRALKLDNVSVREYRSETTGRYDAFELLSTEKSFHVIANNEEEALDWILDIRSAVKGLLGDTTSSDDSSSTLVAPLWVSDKEAEQCSICEQSFTLFNRRHHCRQCGAVICSTHSKHRVVLPNIHKNDKQRVCDHCFFHLLPPHSSNLTSATTSTTSTPVSTPPRASIPNTVSTTPTKLINSSKYTSTTNTAIEEQSPSRTITFASGSHTPVKSNPTASTTTAASPSRPSVSLTGSRFPYSPVKKIPSPPSTPPQSKVGYPRPIDFRHSNGSNSLIEGPSITSNHTTTMPYSAISSNGNGNVNGRSKYSSHSVFGDNSEAVSGTSVSEGSHNSNCNSSEVTNNALLSTLTSLKNTNIRPVPTASTADYFDKRRASTGTAAVPVLASPSISQSCHLLTHNNHRSKIVLNTSQNVDRNGEDIKQPQSSGTVPPPPPPPPRRASFTSNTSTLAVVPPPPPPPPRKPEIASGTVTVMTSSTMRLSSVEGSANTNTFPLSKLNQRIPVVTPDDLKQSLMGKNNQLSGGGGTAAGGRGNTAMTNSSNQSITAMNLSKGLANMKQNRPMSTTASTTNTTTNTDSDSGTVLSMLSAVMQDRRNSILQVAKHDFGDNKSDGSSSGFSDSDTD